MPDVTPARIMQIATGHWAAQILACSVEYDLFTHLADRPATAVELAGRAGISERGAQALLDGALGLGFITLDGGVYRNAPEAATFLVKGLPTYLGFAGIASFDWAEWSQLKEAVKTGTTPAATTIYEIRDNEFWEKLVTAIAPMAAPIADGTAEHLGVGARPAFHMLDVGGGAGMYSAVWLKRNPKGRATQLDWPNVNPVARNFVAKFGVADRFETIDGNLLELGFGRDEYDYAIFSHMAHGLSPEQNLAAFKKFRTALKKGGTLVVSDFILDDQRRGHPMALLFYANMLHSTKDGRTYTRAEYASWLHAAGFHSLEFQAFEPSPVTVVYAS